MDIPPRAHPTMEGGRSTTETGNCSLNRGRSLALQPPRAWVGEGALPGWSVPEFHPVETWASQCRFYSGCGGVERRS